MVTSLKKFSRNIFIKIIAFILIILCVFGVATSIFNLKGIKYYESIIYKDFFDSEELTKIYDRSIRNIITALDWYGHPSQYNYALEYFKANQGIYFSATDGIVSVSNTTMSIKDFKALQSYVIIEGEEISLSPDTTKLRSHVSSFTFDYTGGNPAGFRYKINVGLSDKLIEAITNQWNKDRQAILEVSKIIISSLIGMLISFIYLVLVTGRKSTDDEIHLSIIDKLLFTDINLIITFVTFIVGLRYFINDPYIYNYQKIPSILLALFTSSILLVFVLSLFRHIKNKTFVKHSLIYIVLSFIYKIFKNIYRFIIDLFLSGPLMIKSMFILCLYTFAFIILAYVYPPLVFVLFISAVYLIYIYVKKFNLIKQVVKNIKNGDLENSIAASITGKGELALLANDINSVAEGLDKAVRNEIKSQRMKSELISNVSHDIKTPLTSIINYVDLLKKEGMNSENASKYLEILEQKSQRLKVLTEDLFEAAKASSGDMPINLERIDVFSLIQQGLAELDDKIEKSGLHFKINLPEEKVFVLADGRLLWRVIENLLSNVFKYALKGSRVYIDLINNDDLNKISLIIKNISSYELNVPVDELMERFKRADESRNSEGSGLGLAIAKDLMEMQKGSLNLEIDGDLFKAIVTIPKCKSNEASEELTGEI